MKPSIAVCVEDQEELVRELGAARGSSVLLLWFRLNREAFRAGTARLCLSLNALHFVSGLGRRQIVAYIGDLARLGFLRVNRQSRTTATGQAYHEASEYELLRGAYLAVGGSDSELGGSKTELGGSEKATLPGEKKEPHSNKGTKKTRGSREAFTPPTLEQVREYCRERKNRVDAQYWHDHYTSNGWRVGKNPMRDWRAAVRKWESNGNGQAPAPAPGRAETIEDLAPKCSE